MSRSAIATTTFLTAGFVGMTLLCAQEINSGPGSKLPAIDRPPEVESRVRQRVPAEVYGVTDIVTQGLNDPSRGPFRRNRIRVQATHDENGKKTAREVILVLRDASDADEIIRSIRQIAKQHEIDALIVEPAAGPQNTGRLMFGIGVKSDSGVTGEITLDDANLDLTTAGKLPVQIKQSLDDLRDEIQLLRKDVAALRELLQKKQ